MLNIEALQRLISVPVEGVTDLGSRHLWSLHRVTLAGGRMVFVKVTDAGSGVFDAEAAGLRWLAEACAEGADPVAEEGDSLVVPVIGVDEHMLVLPWVEQRSATAAAAERFGRELAGIHGVRARSYGAPWPGFIASLPLDNTVSDGGWARWYGERRLAPFLRRAADQLDSGERRLIERVIENVESLAGPPEPPSRIHGDLWSGNVLWTEGRGVLIDPAAHGGHRETDLAMLALFGAPHLDRILAAYREAYPLADGWRARVPLHQLHPLLVHLALFGAGYRSQVVECAAAALASIG